MEFVLLVVHLIIAIALIAVVLLQRSEGGALGMGGGGGGGMGNLFSARGVGNALTRTTAYLAIAFFATSIGLTMLAIKRTGGTSVFQQTTTQAPSQGTGTGTAPASTGSALPKLPDAPKAPVGQ
jgi:preprotein translocase subunit SecG